LTDSKSGSGWTNQVEGELLLASQAAGKETIYRNEIGNGAKLKEPGT
jgi:hypothetical protein